MMRARWIYTGCDTEDERALAGKWEELQSGFKAKLEAVEQPAEDVVFSAVHDRDDSPPWRVQGVVTFAAKVCIGDASAAEPESALKECIHQLAGKIDRLRQELPETPTRRRELTEISDLLKRAREQGQMKVFAAFLRPLLVALGAHAARELAIREADEELPAGEWEVDDLLDETLLLAWENYGKRPPSIPLDAWLLGLLGQVLETTSHNGEVSLNRVEEESRRRPFDEEASLDQWVEQFPPREDLELSDLLPGELSVSAWEQLEPEHRDVGLNHLLSQLSRTQRQALLLSAVHGLEPGEIAAIEEISPGEAESAITSARDALSQMLNQDEVWPDVQETIERRLRSGSRRSRR